MNVLVVGAGGREHALTWKLAQSPKVEQLFIAPGNAGTALIGENVPAKTVPEIIAWLKAHPVGLVVVGPDQYLADGLTDAVHELGIPVFGPTKAAAELEWSKSYAKQFMKEEGIPTAQFEVFNTAEQALAYVREQKLPIVVKADGLAAGKGVVVAQTYEEAERAIDEIMNQKVHGDAGITVIIEEYLEGFEISAHAFCDGETAVLFPSSKDHKRIFDGDQGPNTGGMGTIAPVPRVTIEDMERIRTRIVLPTLAGMEKRGRPFQGLLYPGIMLTPDGPKVIEFNARFGDPETQSYMRLLETDLLDMLLACANGSLEAQEIRWREGHACCIVAASKGYPGAYEKGVPITLPEIPDDIVIFHAGTDMKDETLVTNGGRVLNITAVGATLDEALKKAYGALSPALFAGVQYRTDIGANV